MKIVADADLFVATALGLAKVKDLLGTRGDYAVERLVDENEKVGERG